MVNRLQFQELNQTEFSKNDMSLLDLAIVIDCTGSMGSYIQNATDVIKINILFIRLVNWLFLSHRP